jgi:hypothetical protein
MVLFLFVPVQLISIFFFLKKKNKRKLLPSVASSLPLMMSTPPKSPFMGSVGLPSQPPKVPTKKEKFTVGGSAERIQGGSAEGRTMVLEVVGSDPEVGTKEAIKASPLRVGT